jgi:hypothetical protein
MQIERNMHDEVSFRSKWWMIRQAGSSCNPFLSSLLSSSKRTKNSGHQICKITDLAKLDKLWDRFSEIQPQQHHVHSWLIGQVTNQDHHRTKGERKKQTSQRLPEGSHQLYNVPFSLLPVFYLPPSQAAATGSKMPSSPPPGCPWTKEQNMIVSSKACLVGRTNLKVRI